MIPTDETLRDQLQQTVQDDDFKHKKSSTNFLVYIGRSWNTFETRCIKQSKLNDVGKESEMIRLNSKVRNEKMENSRDRSREFCK